MTDRTVFNTSGIGADDMLIEAVKKAAALRDELKEHEAASKKRTEELKREIYETQRIITIDGAGLDLTKIELARTILTVRGEYAHAGDDRASVIADAVHEIATGNKRTYHGLDRVNFGTKSYDLWHGQRCDCEAGMGPRHGSIIFQVGLTKDAKAKGGIAALSDNEREAAVYLLTRLEAVQKAETSAKDAA